MFTIGEFAQSTGLSVRTLRYYDEIGLLPPDETDRFSGYRRYSAHQLNSAVLLRVLRAAGMSIADMKLALNESQNFVALIDKRKREIATQRMLEDWALEKALQVYGRSGTTGTDTSHNATSVDTAHIDIRKYPAVKWIGVETSVDLKGIDDTESESVLEAHTSRLEQLYDELIARAGAVAADGWTRFSCNPAYPSVLTVTCAVAFANLPSDMGEVPDGFALTRGELPERREAVVTWFPAISGGDVVTYDGADATSSDPSELLPGGALPSQESIALCVYAEEHGIPLSPSYQRVVHAESGSRVELSVVVPD